MGKLNSILQQPPSNLPLLYDRAPRSRGLEMKPSMEASVPQSILREIRNRPVAFALSDRAFGTGLRAEGLCHPDSGLSLELISTSHRRRALSACFFPNNPNDAVRGSGEGKSWGQRYSIQAPLGVGLPQDPSYNPTPPSQSLFSLFNIQEVYLRLTRTF